MNKKPTRREYADPGPQSARIVRGFRRLTALAGAAAITASLVLVSVTPAAADTAPLNPADPATPETVSADALPTVQIDGVVWQQVAVGNTVYVAGEFTKARPAGAAPGTNTVTRNNILAYNLTTGELISSFAPSLNAQAKAITASPDGTRIYVGGTFTQVNGVNAYRIAALNPTTGELITSFKPAPNSKVSAIAATNTTVYFGGVFSSVGSTSRSRLASVNASDGKLTSWAPTANGAVTAMAMSPDQSRIAVGGAFTTLNNSGNPGYGLGQVSAANGALLPFAVNSVVRDAGSAGAITSLTAGDDVVYGSGYDYGGGANFEGSFAAKWDGGAIKWLEDCHGDTYGVAPLDGAVYTAGHAHMCTNIGGFPEVTPRRFQRGLAFSEEATQKITRERGSYVNFEGKPAPSLQTWFPDIEAGSYTGKTQGPWTVATAPGYVLMGGEFPKVNGKPQQGLVRFATKDRAPNRLGPQDASSESLPTVKDTGKGGATVTWKTNMDQDNQNLTYRVIRDGNIAAPVHTVTEASTFWQRPSLTFTDTGLSSGAHTYRIFVTDPFGNELATNAVSVNVTGGGQANTAPIAAFTATTAGLTVNVNGSGSTDPGGSIAGYAWDLGDGSTATGATASRTYAAPGTYTVSLTVTDNGGAANTLRRAVTVGSPTVPPPPAGTLARDTFARTVSGGWGTADAGGRWTVVGTAGNYSVGSGAGSMLVNAGGSAVAQLNSVSATDARTSFSVGVDKKPNGGGLKVLGIGRRIAGAGEYRGGVSITSAGAVNLSLTKVLGSAESSLKSASVPGLALAPGEQLNVLVRVSGVSPTTVEAKAWKAGTAEPSGWQVTVTDSSAGLQAAGGVGIYSYLSGTATVGPILLSIRSFSAQ